MVERRRDKRNPAAKAVRTPCITRFIKTCLRRDELGQQFAELAKLDKARIWVVMEVSFGKRPQPHELNVVRFKKAEIAGLNVHD